MRFSLLLRARSTCSDESNPDLQPFDMTPQTNAFASYVCQNQGSFCSELPNQCAWQPKSWVRLRMLIASIFGKGTGAASTKRRAIMQGKLIATQRVPLLAGYTGSSTGSLPPGRCVWLPELLGSQKHCQYSIRLTYPG